MPPGVRVRTPDANGETARWFVRAAEGNLTPMNANVIITIIFVSWAVLTAGGVGLLAARSWHGVDDPALERRQAKGA
jgi:hypothetical protein